MTTDTTGTHAAPRLEHPSDYSAQVTPPAPAMTEAERLAAGRARNERAGHDLKFFAATVTQGEWIAVTRGLDMPRAVIGADQSLTLIALAWVKDKREKGAASWDDVLALTDAQLLERHGFDPEALEDDED